MTRSGAYRGDRAKDVQSRLKSGLPEKPIQRWQAGSNICEKGFNQAPKHHLSNHDWVMLVVVMFLVSYTDYRYRIQAVGKLQSVSILLDRRVKRGHFTFMNMMENCPSKN